MKKYTTSKVRIWLGFHNAVAVSIVIIIVIVIISIYFKKFGYLNVNFYLFGLLEVEYFVRLMGHSVKWFECSSHSTNKIHLETKFTSSVLLDSR